MNAPLFYKVKPHIVEGIRLLVIKQWPVCIKEPQSECMVIIVTSVSKHEGCCYCVAGLRGCSGGGGARLVQQRWLQESVSIRTYSRDVSAVLIIIYIVFVTAVVS